MSSLLIIFILASVVLIMQLMQAQTEFDKEVEILKAAEEVRKDIITETAEELQKRGIKVTVSENNSVISIPNEILGFETGEFNLHERYKPTAREIGMVLYSVISKNNRVDYLDTIFVEGHTDKRAFYGFGDKGNWGLSAFRAISLWQFWLNNLPDNANLGQMRNKEGLPLFSVSGYGETRPVREVQKTEDDYRINRRIDIRLTIRRPNSEDYQALKMRLN
jgi:flagellar motor protein MotB